MRADSPANFCVTAPDGCGNLVCRCVRRPELLSPPAAAQQAQTSAISAGRKMLTQLDDERRNDDSTDRPPFIRLQFQLRHLFAFVVFAGLGIALFSFCMRWIENSRRSQKQHTAMWQVRDTGGALNQYQEANGAFPPQFVVDRSGRPMQSWRLLILPYLDYANLYNVCDRRFSWDSPANSILRNTNVSVYSTRLESRYTDYLLLAGPGTAFPGKDAVSRREIVDGLENTLILAQSADSDVLWMEPRDIDVRHYSFKVNQPGTLGISGPKGWRPLILFADGRAAVLDDLVSPSLLRALTTIQGSEPVTRQTLIEEGHVDYSPVRFGSL